MLDDLRIAAVHFPVSGYRFDVSSLSLILTPEADGTLHLPVPEELRGRAVKVEAMLQPAEGEPAGQLKGFGALKGEIWMAPDFDGPLDDFAEYTVMREDDE